MSQRHAPKQQRMLIEMLAGCGYFENYVAFALKYPEQRDVDGPPLDLKRSSELFAANGAVSKLNKRFKVITFDPEQIAGWRWEGSLVVKRYDQLEPMMEGVSDAGDQSVGTTLMIMAGDVARLNGTYDQVWATITRPKFDGDMRTMERMVPDLIGLFRSIKDVIRQGWPATHDLLSAAAATR